MSNTQRSLKLMRDAGWTCAIVEHWNAHAFIRQDLFGFADLLCIREGGPFLAVQTTAWSAISARLNKIAAEPKSLTFISCGGAIEVHGWKKQKGRWVYKIVKYPNI